MSIKNTPGLYEFLQDAELIQYYTELNNVLQVHNVGQLKYVTDDDLANIGMSKPETRRLKTYFNKYCPGNYASKIRKLLGRREETKDEFLLGEENHTTRGSVRVPSQHIIQADSINVYKELGQGEFGVVQQGVWTDEDGMRHQVAVKCLSKKRMQNNTVEFMKEYEIMQTIDHNNIVRLYGVVLDSTQIMLITELAPLRSLLECLKEPSLRSTFTVSCLTELSQQICPGNYASPTG
jgi:activated CDC42 kinase 1